MSAGNVSRVVRAPGRIVVEPTDLAEAYPYGGTEIGLTKTVVVQSLGKGFRVQSEGLGEASDILEADNHYVMACFLRGWDREALEQLWSDNYVAGASGHAVLSVPGVAKPGASALGRARKILFVADDPLSAPSVLIFRGVPDWADGAALNFARSEEFGLPLAIECMRDNDGRILQIGMLGDLSLTP